MRLFWVAIIIVLSCVSAAWSAGDDRQAYVAALTRLLQISSRETSEDQIQRLNEARQAFQRFADDHPESIYADDARVVYSLVEFMGALMVPPRDIKGAEQMILLMDQTVRAYPDGRVEDLTYSILREELGDQAVGGSFYIPYNLIVGYMQALKASQTRDYGNAISGFLRLKEELAPMDDEAVAIEIYVPLYIAFVRTGQSAKAAALIDEARQAYPGSSLESVLAAMKAAEKNKKDND